MLPLTVESESPEQVRSCELSLSSIVNDPTSVPPEARAWIKNPRNEFDIVAKVTEKEHDCKNWLQ